MGQWLTSFWACRELSVVFQSPRQALSSQYRFFPAFVWIIPFLSLGPSQTPKIHTTKIHLVWLRNEIYIYIDKYASNTCVKYWKWVIVLGKVQGTQVAKEIWETITNMPIITIKKWCDHNGPSYKKNPSPCYKIILLGKHLHVKHKTFITR